MSCRGPRLCAVFAIAALLAGCSRTPEPQSERVAILPFENLTADPSFDWASRALPAVVAAQAQVYEAGGIREAQTARATHTIQGYITREGGRLRAHATVRVEAAGNNLRALTASGESVLQLAEALARQYRGELQPYTTTSEQALRELYSGAPEKAMAADPRFGSAYVIRAQQLFQSGDRAGAGNILEAGRNAKLTPLDRARMEYIRGELANDPRIRLGALRQIADLTIADPGTWRAVAELYMGAKNFKGASDAYGKLLGLTPGDPAVLNSRAYALAFSGDFEGARAALEDYRRVAPSDVNAIDSLGEIHFWFGHWNEAERLFLEAHAANPKALGGAEPVRAALARFLGGDTPGADAIFGKYTAGMPAEEASLRRSIWMRITGRKPQSQPRTSLEHSLAALWALLGGDRAAAFQHAQTARSIAALPDAVGLSSAVLLLAQPSATVEEWTARIARATPAPAARDQLLLYALLLDRKFADASTVAERVYQKTPGLLVNETNIAFAWALEQSGRSAEARRIMPGFLPPSSFAPALNLVLFERAVTLRRRYDGRDHAQVRRGVPGRRVAWRANG